MKELIDIIVWGGMIYFLFIFLRGMNEQQIQKHDKMLKQREKRNNKRTKIDD
jgi:hypothetical protein